MVKKKILVVEDSKTQALKLQSLLEKKKYLVRVVDDAKKALDLVSAEVFDLIIVDYTLPSMSGADFCRTVRMDVSRREIPILMFTAEDGDVGEVKGLEAGADAYLKKDVDDEHLYARIKNLLKKDSKQALTFGDRANFIKGARILLIDDSATYRLKIRAELEKQGMLVDEADSGESGLKKIMQKNKYDCVIVDLMMPGISGIDVCSQIHEERTKKDLPIVVLMLTASEDKKALTMSLENGADDFVSKSGEITILIGRIQALLRKKYFEDQNKQISQELKKKELEAAKAIFEKKVSEAKAALADKLEKSERQFRLLAESSPVGIFSANHTGQTVYVNEQGLEILDVTIAEAKSGKWADRLHEEDAAEYLKSWKNTLKNNVSMEIESRVWTKNNMLRTIQVRIVPVDGDDDIKFLGMFEDISKQKELEEIQDTYHGVLSHELRSPLSFVRSVLEILNDDGFKDEPKKQADMVARSMQNLDYTFRLMDNLVYLLKTEHGSLSAVEKVEVKPFLEELVSVLKPQVPKGVKVELSVEKSVDSVVGSQDLLRQVVTNLFSNACRFAKTKIELKAVLESSGDEKFVCFCVENDGQSLKKEILESIFDKFQQSSSGEKGHKGTGLGLALSRQIVLRHRGKIWAENVKKPEGVRFCFTLLPFSTANKKKIGGNNEEKTKAKQ